MEASSYNRPSVHPSRLRVVALGCSLGEWDSRQAGNSRPRRLLDPHSTEDTSRVQMPREAARYLAAGSSVSQYISKYTGRLLNEDAGRPNHLCDPVARLRSSLKHRSSALKHRLTECSAHALIM